MNSSTCCIFNIAPHYREPIYAIMDEELNCDFFLGDRVIGSSIRLMDYQSLRGFKKLLRNKVLFKTFYWQSGILSVVNKPYSNFILTGDFYCVSTWFLLLILKLKGKKTFIWTHGWYGDESEIKKSIKLIFFKLSSGILLYGNYAREKLVEVGVPKKKLTVVYNSLDYDLHVTYKKLLKRSRIYEQHFSNNNPVLIFLGRLTPEKRLGLLVDAQEILAQKGIYYNIMILGDGPMKKELIKKVEEKGLSQFYWFFGACYDEEKIAQFLYDAEVCVSPGNIGLTGIHSLTYGTPAITHDNIGNQMPEFEVIVEGVTGSFFKDGDAENLAFVIHKFLKDTAPREQTRNQCFDIIERYYNPHYQLGILKQLINW